MPTRRRVVYLFLQTSISDPHGIAEVGKSNSLNLTCKAATEHISTCLPRVMTAGVGQGHSRKRPVIRPQDLRPPFSFWTPRKVKSAKTNDAQDGGNRCSCQQPASKESHDRRKPAALPGQVPPRRRGILTEGSHVSAHQRLLAPQWTR